MPKGDQLGLDSPEWLKRQARHMHNGHFGRVQHARAGMNYILSSSTATAEAKALARVIHAELSVLGGFLECRVEDDEVIPNRSEKTMNRRRNKDLL